ncbi:ATP-grasp domain-containing protein [Macrococcus capreoli]|uniref:ATP-grasp domain-containing protein n=1 Tax=Macrococcus capreoli TaxID=2982690 RepID=UPI003F439DCD
MKETILLLNRFPFWIYNDIDYPFNNVNLILMQERKIENDFPESHYVECFKFDSDNEEEILYNLENIYSKYKFSRVICTTEPLMILASKIRDKFNISNGLNIEETTRFKDKIHMKNQLINSNINIPTAKKVTNKKDMQNFYKNHGKSIVKPISVSGTRNTYVIDSLQDIESVNLNKTISYEIETYITGDMYHIDSVLYKGEILLCSISKYLNSTLNFIKDGYLASVMIESSVLKKKIEQFNKDVLKKFGNLDGVYHLEVFVDKNNLITFCEIAARPGGGGIIPSIIKSYKTDLTNILIKIQLGEELPNIPPPQVLSAYILIHKKAGIIKKISTLNEFNYSWISYKEINGSVGDIFKIADSSISTIASFTVHGHSEKDLIKKLEYIRSKFIYEVEDVINNE